MSAPEPERIFWESEDVSSMDEAREDRYALLVVTERERRVIAGALEVTEAMIGALGDDTSAVTDLRKRVVA